MNTVGILGLGLIGGSFAKAYHEHGWRVLAYDNNADTEALARLSGTVNAQLTRDNISECDILLLAAYPAASIEYFRDMAPYIGHRTIVVDCCGTKRVVCDRCFPVANKNGVTFVGGHPMAGTHNSGFKYARSNMFHNAPMVLVPQDLADTALIGRVKTLLAPAEFGSFSVTTAAEHDEMIAFTSQMPHILSNAFIKSPTAVSHKGFSAGSYKDLTRVAWLEPKMWSELFLENRDCLIAELDFFINSLGEYRSALQKQDEKALIALLEEGRRRKAEVDGR